MSQGVLSFTSGLSALLQGMFGSHLALGGFRTTGSCSADTELPPAPSALAQLAGANGLHIAKSMALIFPLFLLLCVSVCVVLYLVCLRMYVQVSLHMCEGVHAFAHVKAR